MLRNLFRVASKQPFVAGRLYHQSKTRFMGFNEFFDQLQPDEAMTAGRAWTAADLRRKVRRHIFLGLYHKSNNHNLIIF